MQVNFKGLYAIINKEENLRNMKRESVQQISPIKFNSFLEDTEEFKVKGSYLYQNDETGDYFISIKREMGSDKKIKRELLKEKRLKYSAGQYLYFKYLVRKNVL